jgi:hypothetical protein
MIGALLWFVGLVVQVEEIFILPLVLSSAQNKIFFFSPHTFSLYMSPSPSKLGRQSCRVAFLLICVSGCETNKSYHLLLSSPHHLAFTVKGQCNMTFSSLKLSQMARLIHYLV